MSRAANCRPEKDQVSLRSPYLLASLLWVALGCGGATEREAAPPFCAEQLPAPGHVKLSTGNQHICALRPGEALLCWGQTAHASQLADVIAELPSAPVDVTADWSDWVMNHPSLTTCVLEASGVATCSPAYEGGVTGPSIAGVRTVGVRWGMACSIREDRSGVCWMGSLPDQEPWEFSSGPLWALTVGSDVCALDADCKQQCWSRDSGPGDVPAGPFRSLAGLGGRGCGIHPDGSLDCWGNAAYGGDGTMGPSPPPPPGAYDQVGVGAAYNCAVATEDHHLECWGVSNYGTSAVPGSPPLPPPGRYRQVVVGFYHACAVREDDTVVCWAENPDEPEVAGLLDVPAELR